VSRGGNVQSHNLPAGASIWLPRDIPHTWANTSNAEARLILVCQPGGFEKFFEEMEMKWRKCPRPKPSRK
jgi:quercetin dioxygenase-like cupin family protein